MPDIHVAFTIPSVLLWALVAYLAAGLLAYLPILVWANSLIAGRRSRFAGLSVLRWALSSVLWVPLLIAEHRAHVASRRAMARFRTHINTAA